MRQSVRRRPLRRRSSGELVADDLRRDIIAGVLQPGQRLTQEDIGARLGVSRVPVREALVILEQEGWVKMEMHRGARVLPVESSINDNAEVWRLVFGLVARRATERLTSTLDEELQEIANTLATEQDSSNVWQLCELYLDVIFDAANTPLARTLRRIHAMAVDTIFDVVPETIEVTRAGTLAVIGAIRAGDGERAVEAHDAMQRNCLQLLVTAFEGRATDASS